MLLFDPRFFLFSRHTACRGSLDRPSSTVRQRDRRRCISNRLNFGCIWNELDGIFRLHATSFTVYLRRYLLSSMDKQDGLVTLPTQCRAPPRYPTNCVFRTSRRSLNLKCFCRFALCLASVPRPGQTLFSVSFYVPPILYSNLRRKHTPPIFSGTSFLVPFAWRVPAERIDGVPTNHRSTLFSPALVTLIYFT